jgi:sugar phosphate isomerase/epimerase
MMQLACQERLLLGDTLMDRWDIARRAGYDGIELHGPPDFGLRERLPELRRAAAAGVVFSSVCVAMRHFIGDFDAELRSDAIANLKSQLSVIAELGGVGVVTPAAYGMYTRKLPPFSPPPRTEEEDFAVLVAALTELGEHAAAIGVLVLLEPLNRYEDHMINRLDQGAAICRAVDIDAVKLVVDTYHMNIEEDHPADAVRQAGELVGHVQLGDSARWQPGTGHVDFAGIVDALHAIGFDGWLALECNLRGEPTAALAQGSSVLRPLIGLRGRETR